MAKALYPQEQAGTFVVNLPADSFEAHAHRIVRILGQYGYVAMAMTSAYMLEMADRIREDMAAAEAAQDLLEQADHKRRELDDYGDH